MTDEKHDTTAQRGAAEVDVAFKKLVSDLHASRENPVEPGGTKGASQTPQESAKKKKGWNNTNIIIDAKIWIIYAG